MWAQMALLFVLAGVLLLTACEPVAVTSAVTPAPSATPVPTLLSPTAIPTWTPTPIPPTPTPMPIPTFDPASVASITAAGRARLEAAGVEPLCLRWEDVDGDGNAEWLGMYMQPGDPPELMAFVLDGGSWYELRPLAGEKYGLGVYPTCELEVRDVNADGRVEILVWGHAESSTDVLHIFVWDGKDYALLVPFEGKAGVRVENADGDLFDEVVVGYLTGSAFVWEAVYTWDGSSYAWTWERYAWFYLDRPHVYLTDTSEHAVISFYLALNDRDMPGAYGLLSPATQAAQPYETWAVGYATTIAAEAGAVYEVGREGDAATVVAQVRAYDNVDGRVVVTVWDVKWTVVQTTGGWRLDRAAVVQLEQWEADYYP